MSTTPSPGKGRQSKNERRDAAREQARALREQQLKRDRRNRVLGISMLSVAVLALVGVGAWLFLQSGSSSDEALPDYPDTPLSEVSDVPSTALPEGGIPVSATGVGGTVDDSTTRVDVYLDYMCPACGAFEEANGENLISLAADGSATVVYHPIAILNRFSNGTGYSTRAASAAALVADEAPDQFAAFNEQLFAGQPEENTSGLTNAEIADIAREAGVADGVADKIADGSALDRFGQWVTSATNEVTANPDLVNEQNGSFGTPTITIDGDVWTENWTDPNALLQAVGS
ncbi:thioredoxin domain-containing protein [Cellulomonas sp. IC4_254]|uniref:thioredoxin domain-containing protein n=1 Tax=Cellulomonas sp. IC4_254 TaxID=2714040 RepID=UPI001420A117|nr:thioredoxin domain-containing protein [Cellulomonas sp. IC4_254]NHT18772.1 thioredoxin domain-containing protein [Cellulomonas sp. IC4_254]